MISARSSAGCDCAIGCRSTPNARCPQPPGRSPKRLPLFTRALSADLNISGAIAALNQGASGHRVTEPAPMGPSGNPTYATELQALQAMDSVLGVLDLEYTASVGEELDAAWIERKIAERNEARSQRDWARDRAREELAAVGIAIKDGPEGTTWSKVIQ